MPNARVVRCTSVVDPPHEPALAQHVVINPVASALPGGLPGTGGPNSGSRFCALPSGGIKTHFHIPFVLVPRVFPPPIPGSSPRPRCRQYFSPLALENQARRPPLAQFQLDGKRRTKNAEAGPRGIGEMILSGEPGGRGLLRARHKTAHLKFSRPVRIEQRWRAPDVPT